MKLSELSSGDRFEITGLEDEGPYVLLRLTQSRALVRPERRVTRTFETALGDEVAFDASCSAENISRGTIIRKLS